MICKDDRIGNQIVLTIEIKGESQHWVFQWPCESGSAKEKDRESSLSSSGLERISEGTAVWVRKIQYACGKGVVVNQMTGSFAQRLEGISTIRSLQNQSKKVKKRLSLSLS